MENIFASLDVEVSELLSFLVDEDGDDGAVLSLMTESSSLSSSLERALADDDDDDDVISANEARRIMTHLVIDLDEPRVLSLRRGIATEARVRMAIVSRATHVNAKRKRCQQHVAVICKCCSS